MSVTKESVRLLDGAEISKILRVSESWLKRNRRTADRIPFIKINRKIYYEERELIAWLKKHKVTDDKA